MADRTADELEIRTLVARYAEAVTRRDADAWGRTWAEDGEWQLIGRKARGRDDLVKLWLELMGGLEFVCQLPAGGIIDIDGDTGRGRWQITEHGRFGGGSPLLNVGLYHDRYVRENGRWRFEFRRFDPLYMGAPDMSGNLVPIPDDLPPAD
jgi:ketosteroid isomerase-like protein